MQRLPILFVNTDPVFFADPENAIERRGCDLFPARSVAEVGALLKQHRFGLGVVNATSIRLPSDSLRALHQALRRGGLPVSMILVARQEDAEELRALALPDLHVVVPPIKHRFLQELSSRLIGIGARRAATTVVQVFFEDENRTKAMGFLENVSRHGLLVRTDAELPEMGTEGAAAFILPGSGEQNEVRVRLTRRDDRGVRVRYGLAFTDLTPEIYERVADFVGP